MAQGQKMTEQQRQAIFADYAMTHSYRATARNFGISDTAVKRIVKVDPQLSKALAEKKAETSMTVLDWLERQGERHQNILDKLLKRIDEGAADLSPAQAATVYGILIDKQQVIKGTGGVNINISFGKTDESDISDFGK